MSRTVLSTMGQLSVVSGSAFRPFVPDVMPLVIEAIQDSAAPDKRLVAVRALGQVGSRWQFHEVDCLVCGGLLVRVCAMDGLIWGGQEVAVL